MRIALADAQMVRWAMKRTNVVVVGAGPVGGIAAYYLACHGLDVVLIEAGPDCAQDLRASTFHPPTLEMLDTLGMAQPLIDMGLKAPVYHWRERKTGEFFAFDLSEIADATRFPFRIQCEQYHLARMLAAKLQAAPNAEVLFSHRMLGYQKVGEKVRVSVETPVDILEIEADFLIGADGANSVVRKLMGVEFEGFTYPEKFLCLTTSEPLEEHLPNLAPVNYVSDPEEWLVLLRVPSLWRVLVPTEEGEDDEYLRSDAKKEKVFGRLLGKPEVETHHRTIYRVHQRVAKYFREGRVAIIGDAAHLNNPLGGFGMNSGIHDAFNLCPKIVSILKDGAAMDTLLSEFNEQRHRQTREFVQAQTIANMEFIREGDAEEHRLRREKMSALTNDPAARRAYLLRQSMIESVRAAAAEDAQSAAA
jgi:3-(3-hydroxy-phenyl)propionate hydroxylase